MIPNSIARHFSDLVRARGKQLYATGAVHIALTMPELALADVQGSILYRASVQVHPEKLRLSCTCMHAASGNACKHLWALLLALDTTGALSNLLLITGDAHSIQIDNSPHNPERTESISTASRPPLVRPPQTPSWQHAFERARWKMQYEQERKHRERVDWPDDRRLVYIINSGVSRTATGIVVELGTEKRARDGMWGPPRHFAYPSAVWFAVPDHDDQLIARMLLGAAPVPDYGRARTSFVLPSHAYDTVLRMICDTGRARLRTPSSRTHLPALRWDDGGVPPVPWRFTMSINQMRSGEHVLEGSLVRGQQRIDLSRPDLLHESGLIIVNDTVARLDHDGAFPIIAELQAAPGLAVGRDMPAVLERLYALPNVPSFTLPESVSINESHATPVPVLTFVQDRASSFMRATAGLQLGFQYGELRLNASDGGTTRYCANTNTLHHRDAAFEGRAREKLMSLGASSVHHVASGVNTLTIPRERVPLLAVQLAREGWRVEADGRAFHAPGAVRASVRSGVDWFDLDGTIEYGNLTASLASVLEARHRGEAMVLLSDGSYGLMPDDLLSQLGPLLAAGTRGPNATRFRSSQIALLDALLESLPEVDMDEAFASARAELEGFTHIAPADAPASFTGVLREYQREGLGWMHFLRRFGFGGCLADDMGLGKTIQVLALLEARRVDGHGPSLVVVPRSLVFNWRREAERFAPMLRVLDWSSTQRRVDSIDTADVDVLIVTYGTLRRDIMQLGGIEFDYVVLDEAHAIKNSATATAKSARLLRAKHRLALSGTPVENRIEELWSLLDFLNPGMLGASVRFASALRADTESEELLAHALRPVILRRTKAAVAPELPERIETTLEVELEAKQRAFYDSLRDKYRNSLLQMVDSEGMQKSRMHILEALLRLRQAACHPVLADPRKHALPSAKLDALLPALREVSAEGNKALVFSQFTGFLALVREALDKEGIVYEYLDGRTRDRQTRVDRFQNDPACPLFLISLKAGGHGLNLTAADYVFLLDPWWNPAVEAQAIDRVHRIGRTRRVIATRLVARDTIEEKILLLQASKRALADAILTADKGIMASIGREELELLLG